MEKKQKDMSERNRLFKKRITKAYYVLVVVMFLMLISNLIFTDKRKSDYGLGTFEQWEQYWVDQSGEVFDFDHMENYAEGRENIIFAYLDLPDDIDDGDSLVFRSKNCSVNIEVDKNSIYETDMVSAPFYNHSPGTRWNVVHLSEAYAGKRISMELTMAYKDGRAEIDNVYLGDAAAVIVSTIRGKAVAFFVSLCMLFVGLIYLFGSFIFNRASEEKDLSLRYLGLFAVILSIWGLLETNLFQFFSSYLREIHVADNMMLVLGSVCLFLYMEEDYGLFRQRWSKVLVTLNIGYILFATVSQLVGWKDFHQTLNGAVAAYAIASVLLIVCTVHQSIENRRAGKKDPFAAIQQIGVFLLGLSVFFDFMRYMYIDVMDRAFFTRIGMLVCILFLGVGNISHMITLVKQGFHSDIISRLAYEDGLTEVGNRTAYKERIDKVRSGEKESVRSMAIIMFDINCLKEVNDHLGHKAGDELILATSKLLKEAFSKTEAEIYRIGGDEFVVIVVATQVEQIVEEGLRRFEERRCLVNELGNYRFEIEVAKGVGIADIFDEEHLMKAQQTADHEMYKNKSALKQRRAKVVR